MISIMFHSAGLNSLRWRSSHVSEPLDLLARKLEVLRDGGWNTIFMREAAEHIGRRRDLLAHLNFDDGYLDNWVHIFPLLERNGFKATIYVTVEFVDPGDVVRERRPLSERAHDAAACCAGFLSYAEMRQMEASGLVEIQSHALTHTWYFKGPEIVDFWHPGAATRSMGPVWMVWNRFPERKPFYLLEAPALEKMIPYGTPIYEHGKSLATTRYFPDEAELESRLIETAGSKSADFYRRPDWRREFHALAAQYRKERGTVGRYESERERGERISHELSESKQRIETGLGHAIDGICWPGGGVTPEVMRTAKQIGYRYFTLPSAWRRAPVSEFAEEMIPRIGSLTQIEWRGRGLGPPSKREFKHYLRSQNGYAGDAWMLRLSKLARLLFGSSSERQQPLP